MNENIPNFKKQELVPYSKNPDDSRPETIEEKEKGLINKLAQEIGEPERVGKLISPIIAEKLQLAVFRDKEGRMLNLYNTEFILTNLRSLYPTTRDIRMDLSKRIQETISVKRAEGQSESDYLKNINNKKLQYRDGMIPLLDGLELIYKELGSKISPDIQERIVENIKNITKNIMKMENNPLSKEEIDYFQENILAAIKQKLNPGIKKEIKQQLDKLSQYTEQKEKSLFRKKSLGPILTDNLKKTINLLRAKLDEIEIN